MRKGVDSLSQARARKVGNSRARRMCWLQISILEPAENEWEYEEIKEEVRTRAIERDH